MLDKYQNFQKKNKNKDIKLNKNNNFDILDKELAKGLDNLNKNNNIINAKEEQKIDNPKYKTKIIKNPKFKEIISMINDKGIKRNQNYNNFNKKSLLSFMNNTNHFSNINFFKPKKYVSNTLEEKSFGNSYKKYENFKNKYYISCIDGKAIVNGTRQDIPFISKFNNKLNINNNNNLFGDLSNTYKNSLYDVKSFRRDNSLKINKYLQRNTQFNYNANKTQKNFNKIYETNDFNFDKLKKNYPKENLTNTLNKMNDNYFTRELKILK